MSSLSRVIVAVTMMISFTSCNYFTFTPRSKKNIQKEKPSAILMERIIAFREEQNTWPFSKEDFISKGLKYRQAFDGFPYLQTRFKVVDINTMVFYFSEHIKDVKNFQQTQKADLNSYGGQVRFSKENDRFIWKLKMN